MPVPVSRARRAEPGTRAPGTSRPRRAASSARSILFTTSTRLELAVLDDGEDAVDEARVERGSATPRSRPRPDRRSPPSRARRGPGGWRAARACSGAGGSPTTAPRSSGVRSTCTRSPTTTATSGRVRSRRWIRPRTPHQSSRPSSRQAGVRFVQADEAAARVEADDAGVETVVAHRSRQPSGTSQVRDGDARGDGGVERVDAGARGGSRRVATAAVARRVAEPRPLGADDEHQIAGRVLRRRARRLRRRRGATPGARRRAQRRGDVRGGRAGERQPRARARRRRAAPSGPSGSALPSPTSRPAAPKAAATRTTAPTLPGSWTPSSQSRSPAQVEDVGEGRAVSRHEREDALRRDDVAQAIEVARVALPHAARRRLGPRAPGRRRASASRSRASQSSATTPASKRVADGLRALEHVKRLVGAPARDLLDARALGAASSRGIHAARPARAQPAVDRARRDRRAAGS